MTSQDKGRATVPPSAEPSSVRLSRRQRAEATLREKLAESPEHLEALSPEAVRIVLHELRVHQIELEMLNEELRRAQAELDTSRARYFDLYDLAPVGYCTVSERGLIVQSNLTAATLLGELRGALVGQPIARFILPEDEGTILRLRRQLIETGEPQSCELRMVKHDGVQIWAHLVVTLALEEGGATALRVALSDVTAQKRSEMEKTRLEAQNRQLQKSESLERMAGAIAHHFNNQLLVVMGNVELAINEMDSQTECVARLADALRSARRAAEMSSLMLTYLGQGFSAGEPLDLAATCHQSLQLLQRVMPRGAVLEADLPSAGPAISADPKQIHQILANLATNAWEASGDGENVIRLSVKTISAAEIPVVNRSPADWQPKNPDYACLAVADRGVGIAPQDLEKLFDPFFSSRFNGRGLGLSVVLGIVRAYQGAITVESDPGHGSVFRVFFPVSTGAVPRSSSRMVRTPVTSEGGTVLVIEDESAVRDFAVRTLSRAGFAVVEAANGTEAVEIVRERHREIGCVLCDVTMPRMDGWETLTALRQLAPGIAVVFTSGYSMAQVMEGDHPEKPQDFLQKPYTAGELWEVVSRVLAAGKNE